jgi:hypothetical protein
MSEFGKLLDTLISSRLGVPPEAITVDFLHEMRKREHADPMFGAPYSPEAQRRWDEKSRRWAQEVLQQRRPASRAN